MRWLAIILIFFYEQKTPQFVLKLNCLEFLTLEFKSTGRAILYTIPIDRPTVYSTPTNLQTGVCPIL